MSTEEVNKNETTSKKVEETKYDIKAKASYLMLLQEPITRMSSTSAIYKGFSAALLAGIASVSFTEVSVLAMILGLIPIGIFCALDMYYLSLERAFRYRYKQVVNDQISVYFSINPKLNKNEKIEAKAGIFECFKSTSIWAFYVPMTLLAVALVFLKWKNHI